MAPKFLAIDFDGTIRDTVTNKPIEGARDAISLLRERGHKVWIHSCNNAAFIERWMNDNDIRFDYICNEKKPAATVYLDDRGLKFETWDKAVKDILEGE